MYSHPMADQIVLAWDVDVKNTSFGPIQAAAALGAVPLYFDPTTDPVLGQLFGLIVASDVSAPTGPTTARRTITLNMTPAFGAPPPFPCRPRTATPPVLPYPLRRSVQLAGFFFVQNGSMVVQTTATQIPALVAGDRIQFLSQEGVFYTLAAPPTSTTLLLTTPFTGKSGIVLSRPLTGKIADTTGFVTAFKEVTAPVTRAALYSTSELDTDAVPTTPPIAAGSGARTVSVQYQDSTGAFFISVVSLTGKRPVEVPLAPGSVDIATITNVAIASVGAFGNSVGQITLVELSGALKPLPVNATPDLFRGRLTDEGQLLITQHLVYLPPSYFALAQQGKSRPQLVGDFFVTTGSTHVPTSVDQTGILAPGNVIQFAYQLVNNTPFGVEQVLYTIAVVNPKFITLTSPFTGVDNNDTQTKNVGTNADGETKGNIGTEVIKKRTAAFPFDPQMALPPSAAELSAPLGQFVAPETAGPPPDAPLPPETVPVPVFLSNLFTRTLQLAIAGVPAVPQPIALV